MTLSPEALRLLLAFGAGMVVGVILFGIALGAGFAADKLRRVWKQRQAILTARKRLNRDLGVSEPRRRRDWP